MTDQIKMSLSNALQLLIALGGCASIFFGLNAKVQANKQAIIAEARRNDAQDVLLKEHTSLITQVRIDRSADAQKYENILSGLRDVKAFIERYDYEKPKGD